METQRTLRRVLVLRAGLRYASAVMQWVLYYTGDATYDTVLTVAFAFVALTAVSAWFLPTPYGRFASPRFGLRLGPRLGWWLMELPATLSFLWVYFHGAHRWAPTPLVFLGVWLIHYGNRGFLFPLRMRVAAGSQATFSLLVVLIGWLATSLHGYLHARFLSHLGTHYTQQWLTDPRFLIGIAIYYAAFVGNLHSDAILRSLRTPQEAQSGQRIYRIPTGGLFRWVSSPSYLTELIAWAGLAVATWSLAGLYIFALSAANLVPRALSTHAWYRQRFPDYPRERTALLPGLL